MASTVRLLALFGAHLLEMLKGYAIAMIIEFILELLLLIGMIVVLFGFLHSLSPKRFSGGDIYTSEGVALVLGILYLIGRMFLCSIKLTASEIIMFILKVFAIVYAFQASADIKNRSEGGIELDQAASAVTYMPVPQQQMMPNNVQYAYVPQYIVGGQMSYAPGAYATEAPMVPSYVTHYPTQTQMTQY